ncbi:beta/alpha barrel domain-containing protein [Actinobacillus delphinicola]|uniref:N-acylglucosamine-6-phosphate 2-epimerase n=1 Tax=Actinobacillus delphinicola TaxID=51161 RepID=A0A448TT38_9PAST|nr:hypothetical protein [Actinobacillus delphinicola]VEJ09065.1 N-acetylmannosamine-6-phosphate 2-epimerase [Actinobacillus delphinicola]
MSNLSHTEILDLLKHGLIVDFNTPTLNLAKTEEAVASLAPFESLTALNGSTTTSNQITTMAQTCINAGATGIRVNELKILEAIRKTIKAPIIASVNRHLENTAVTTTPFLVDVEDLARAGADIIAIDGTVRPHPIAIKDLLNKAHELQCLAMAECYSVEDALNCQKLGFDLIEICAESDKSVSKQIITTLEKSGIHPIVQSYSSNLDEIKSLLGIGAYAIVITADNAQTFTTMKIDL